MAYPRSTDARTVFVCLPIILPSRRMINCSTYERPPRLSHVPMIPVTRAVRSAARISSTLCVARFLAKAVVVTSQPALRGDNEVGLTASGLLNGIENFARVGFQIVSQYRELSQRDPYTFLTAHIGPMSRAFINCKFGPHCCGKVCAGPFPAHYVRGRARCESIRLRWSLWCRPASRSRKSAGPIRRTR